ncbi:MAG: hypothetical protein GX130_06895 [Candidatus Hydrogenedens sp.]|nr:hypothetical protein [Candidatus Hydrogenedens sp.]
MDINLNLLAISPFDVTFRYLPCRDYKYHEEYIWGVIPGELPKANSNEIKAQIKPFIDESVEYHSGKNAVPSDYPIEYYRGYYNRVNILNENLLNDNYRTDGKNILNDFLEVARMCITIDQDSLYEAFHDEKIVDALLRLCNRYGLLQTQSQERASSPNAENALEFGFSVNLVIHNLRNLFGLYLFWERTVLNMDRNDNVLRRIINPTGIWQRKNQNFEEAIIQYVEGVSNRVKHTTKITHTTDGNIVTIRKYSSAMDAALGSMLGLIEAGIQALDGATLATCSQCSRPFFRFHKGKLYCSRCDSNAEKQKRYRQKKKEKKSVEKTSKQ